MQERHKEETIVSKFNVGIWKTLGRYLRRHIGLAVLFLAVMLLSSFLYNSLEPLLTMAAVEALKNNLVLPSWSQSLIPFTVLGLTINFNLITYTIALLALNFAKLITFAIAIYCMNIINCHVMVDLRRDCFDKIQKLTFSYFDKTPSGWIIARVQNDTQTISDTIGDVLSTFIWAIVDLLFAVTTMFTIDWRLSLVVLAITPLLLIVVPFFEKKILRRSREVRAVSSNYIAWVSECITGTKTIKALNLEDLTSDEAREISSTIKKRTRRHQNFSSAFSPLLSVFKNLSQSLIILLIVFIVRGGGDGVSAAFIATVVVFFGFIGKVYSPLVEMVELSSEILANQPSVEKVMQLLNTAVEIKDEGTEELNLHNRQAEIRFEHVHFGYLQDVEVLHDSDFVIAPGTSLAIVGETGSGKSTSVNLLCRFYEPTAGRILIDGNDYRQYTIKSLRRTIGYVQQSPVIFNTTIARNIRYGRLEATDEEVVEAAKSVGIHDFITKLPQGYDTVITAEGSEMSTGQKQLISFARALIRDPGIMILDEATSSIDTETEVLVQQAVERIMPGRTTLIIAHRLSTIVNCDRILVMKNGLVVEDGSHRELMKRQGYYYELYMNQFKDMKIESQLGLEETLESKDS